MPTLPIATWFLSDSTFADKTLYLTKELIEACVNMQHTLPHMHVLNNRDTGDVCKPAKPQ